MKGMGQKPQGGGGGGNTVKNRIAERKERRKEKRQAAAAASRDANQPPRTKSGSSNSNSSGGSGSGSSDGGDDKKLVKNASFVDDYNDFDETPTSGGSGSAGRGDYAAKTNSIHGAIHLKISSMTLDNGTELLADTTLDIVKGRRYGLVGRNGVGKTTLLKRLANKALPGLPRDMKVLLVEQSLASLSETKDTEGSKPKPTPTEAKDSAKEAGDEPVVVLSAIEALVQTDRARTGLLKEQERLELILASGGGGDAETENVDAISLITRTVERLSIIAADLDAMEADSAHARAETILMGLQFTETMRHGPVTSLSGGWRMRLALAQSLFLEDSTDLHVWDEVSNHLDLQGLDWLINYINTKESDEMTLMVVSHDRTFLDAICTDIIVMEHQRLAHYTGNYSAYEQQVAERNTRQSQILDAAERQRSKAQAFVEKQQATAHKKSADPNKQRQAKMVREKKLERIGNYRDDGKRYKMFSLKTLDESSSRLAQQVEIETEEPIVKIYFPQPTWPTSVGKQDTIVRLEDLSFAYTKEKMILNDVTLNIQRGSKIALVGPNGSGKSSLIKLIMSEFYKATAAATNAATTGTQTGSVWLHPNLRVGYISQYTVEHLGSMHANQTVVDYVEDIVKSGRASSKLLAQASGNVRQYLGAFGLGGKHALRRIGNLSGGELMRLSFAVCMADGPGLLLLDEANNHVAMETLEAMAIALAAFDGSVLMVSHNQAFLSGFCRELWVLGDNGRIRVVHPNDDANFDAVFSAYRNQALSVSPKGSGGNAVSQSEQRQRQKAALAKRATTQRATGGRKTAALL